MKNRILNVVLTNIKGITNGKISFPDEEIVNNKDLNNNKFSMMGVYGQNGSGKTTLVNSFYLLKTLSLKRSIYSFINDNRQKNRFSYMINVEQKSGKICYSFLILVDTKPYKVQYTINLGNILEDDNTHNVEILKEELTIINYFSEGTRWKRPFPTMSIDYKTDGFEYLYDGMKHKESNLDSIKASDKIVDLFATKKNCVAGGRSYIFSDENITYLLNHKNSKAVEFGNVLDAFRKQLAFNLFLFSHVDEPLSEVGLGTLVGTAVTALDNREIHGMFRVSLHTFEIDESSFDLYEKFINQINCFLASFVPNFKTVLKKGDQRIINGQNKIKVSIVREISKSNFLPLSEESAGIRKLFFVSCALIYIYGNKDGWLIVDELDSGVYENLLGQILSVLEECGRGQMIFTAHNLVPLERISSSSIVFTTSNKNNSFIHITGLSGTSNLRDVYLRAIKLGGQKEELSTDVKETNIDKSLRIAYHSFLKLGEASNG